VSFNIQGMIIGIAAMSLFVAVMGGTILLMGENYETTGYVGEDIQKFNNMENISNVINTAQDDIDKVTVEQNWFDFFSGIWSKLIIPFKSVYRSFTMLKTIGSAASSYFKLMPVFYEFIITIITTLVIIGLVMIKFHMGRQK